MAEGYTTYESNESIASLASFKDFEQEERFSEILECFYNPNRTGLMCELELSFADGRIKNMKLMETNEPGYHAEQAFVREARNWFRRFERNEMEKLSIRMLISNSPCFNCREDLEHFFVWSKLHIDFTLGVGRLYRNYASVAEIDLDCWKNDLEIRKFTVSIYPIEVDQEITKLRSKVVHTSRKTIDKKIKEQMDNIKNGRSQMKKLKRDLKLKSDFLEKHFTDVTDGQMMLATVVASGFTETGEKRPTASNNPFKTADEGELISRINQLPQSWESIRKTLVLVCACVPSKDCQESITSFLEDKKLEGVKNKLVLYIAKVPVDEERSDFIEWIQYLEERSISVCLQPFYGPLEFITGYKVKGYGILRKHFQDLQREIDEIEMSSTAIESDVILSQDETSSSSSQNQSLEYETPVESMSRADHSSPVSSPAASPLSINTPLSSAVTVNEDSKYDPPETNSLEESLPFSDSPSDSDNDDVLVMDGNKYVKPTKRY